MLCILFSGAPDMKAMDRKDSGISCMSGSPGNVTPYDNMAQSDNFIRQGSGRSSVKSAPGMHFSSKLLISKGEKKLFLPHIVNNKSVKMLVFFKRAQRQNDLKSWQFLSNFHFTFHIQVIHTIHLHQNFINLYCVSFAMPGCALMSTLMETDKPSSQQNGSAPRLSQITKSTEVKRARSPQVTPRRKTKWVKWIKVAPSKAKGTFLFSEYRVIVFLFLQVILKEWKLPG